MIPIHNRSDKQDNKIVIHQLEELTDYDFTKAYRHDYFEFYVFEKGGGTHMIDFEEFKIEADSFHIVAPGQVHQLSRDLKSKGFVFLFSTSSFQSDKSIENFLFDHICLGVHEYAPNYVFHSVVAEKMKLISKNAWEEYKSSNDLKELMVKTQLTELIVYCMQNGKASKFELNQADNDIYILFRRELKNRFRELRMVKDYTSLLNVTDKVLNEIVHAKTGETVSSTIYKQLILEAKRQLNGGSSSKNIAYDLNFNDPGHFSKFFKSQTGIPPSQFGKVHE